MKKIIIKQLEDSLINLDYYDKELNISISTPKNKKFGDLSTNIALLLSKKLNKSPLDIANEIKNKLEKSDLFKAINIAGPGFLNFDLNPKSITNELIEIIDLNNSYGKNNTFKNQKVLVEFVSANPTGPLTVGHGRGAILGDTLSNIFEWNGYTVDREYYYNNAGRQMRILGESVKARYLENQKEQYEFPEGGYEGEYIYDIANNLSKKFGNTLINKNTIFKETAEKYIFENIKHTLDRINITFDSFFNENTLYENKDIYEVINQLRDKGLIYDKDDAIWFHGTKVGRENDRVLVKSSGEPTYRLPDMAYHIKKIERGYNLCVDILQLLSLLDPPH